MNIGFIGWVHPIIDGHTRREGSKGGIKNGARLLVDFLQIDHSNWGDMEMGDEQGKTVINNDVVTAANVLRHGFFDFRNIFEDGLVVTSHS